MRQEDRASHFRQLHTDGPLVLPNAWDAASAWVIEMAGASATGTTSAGISWSYGRGDGQNLGRDEMIQMIRRIVQTVDLPVTADIEGGYGTGSAHDVAETVQAVVAVGVVGINLEDSPGRGRELLLAPEVQAERIRAAREAALAVGGDLVINARTDVYLSQIGAPETRFDEAVRHFGQQIPIARPHRLHPTGHGTRFLFPGHGLLLDSVVFLVVHLESKGLGPAPATTLPSFYRKQVTQRVCGSYAV